MEKEERGKGGEDKSYTRKIILMIMKIKSIVK